MPVRRNSRKRWIYRTVVKLRDGQRVRIFGTPERNTREAAEQAERDHIARVQNPVALPVEKKEVPTLREWFWGADPEADEPVRALLARMGHRREEQAERNPGEEINLFASFEIGIRRYAPR